MIEWSSANRVHKTGHGGCTDTSHTHIKHTHENTMTSFEGTPVMSTRFGLCLCLCLRLGFCLCLSLCRCVWIGTCVVLKPCVRLLSSSGSGWTAGACVRCVLSADWTVSTVSGSGSVGTRVRGATSRLEEGGLRLDAECRRVWEWEARGEADERREERGEGAACGAGM